MKKFITSVAASTLLLGSVLPTAFAEETSVETSPQKPEYSYTFQDVNFTSDVELDELALQDLHSEVLRNSLGSVNIVPRTHDIGSNSTTVIKPEYRTFENTVEKIIVDGVVAIILSKLPFRITSNVLANFYIGKLTGWISGSIKKVYAGAWVSRSWSEYDKTYIYKATVVHYTDSTFSQPKDVAYHEVGRSTDPNLASW